MTSANVVNYRICDSGGNKVGEHSQHAFCKTHWGDLLKFAPPEDFSITRYGLDEAEEYWEDEPENLKAFIDELKSKKAKFNTHAELFAKIRNYGKETNEGR